jgi:hypothetical protein
MQPLLLDAIVQSVIGLDSQWLITYRTSERLRVFRAYWRAPQETLGQPYAQPTELGQLNPRFHAFCDDIEFQACSQAHSYRAARPPTKMNNGPSIKPMALLDHSRHRFFVILLPRQKTGQFADDSLYVFPTSSLPAICCLSAPKLLLVPPMSS